MSCFKAMYSVIQKFFQFPKQLRGKVVVAVAGETKVDQFPTLFALAVGHAQGIHTEKKDSSLRPQVEGDQLRIVLF